MTLDPTTIRHIVGPLDDHLVARIARTGVTAEELEEAALRVTGGEELPSVETGGNTRVHEVVLLLERIELDEERDEMNAESMDWCHPGTHADPAPPRSSHAGR